MTAVNDKEKIKVLQFLLNSEREYVKELKADINSILNYLELGLNRTDPTNAMICAKNIAKKHEELLKDGRGEEWKLKQE